MPYGYPLVAACPDRELPPVPVRRKQESPHCSDGDNRMTSVRDREDVLCNHDATAAKLTNQSESTGVTWGVTLFPLCSIPFSLLFSLSSHLVSLLHSKQLQNNTHHTVSTPFSTPPSLLTNTPSHVCWCPFRRPRTLQLRANVGYQN